ncbi:hypothetical protein H8356DRAFT_1321842 [Neocallimastix lanati (nom. inval.)]|nr:hypothetical protein H8356DRAFT_1321842 [Neocallimastix sp. JGI-2020a]
MEFSDNDRILTIFGERKTVTGHFRDNEKMTKQETIQENNMEYYSKIECSYGYNEE